MMIPGTAAYLKKRLELLKTELRAKVFEQPGNLALSELVDANLGGYKRAIKDAEEFDLKSRNVVSFMDFAIKERLFHPDTKDRAAMLGLVLTDISALSEETHREYAIKALRNAYTDRGMPIPVAVCNFPQTYCISYESVQEEAMSIGSKLPAVPQDIDGICALYEAKEYYDDGEGRIGIHNSKTEMFEWWGVVQHQKQRLSDGRFHIDQ
jgi:hypothetical protein